MKQRETTATGSFKVTQGHRFCYRSKVRLDISEWIALTQLMFYLTPFPSYRGDSWHWSKYRFWQGTSLFNSLIRSEPLNSLDGEIWPPKLETSLRRVLCTINFDWLIDWLIFIKACDKRTCNEYNNSDNESDTLEKKFLKKHRKIENSQTFRHESHITSVTDMRTDKQTDRIAIAIACA